MTQLQTLLVIPQKKKTDSGSDNRSAVIFISQPSTNVRYFSHSCQRNVSSLMFVFLYAGWTCCFRPHVCGASPVYISWYIVANYQDGVWAALVAVRTVVGPQSFLCCSDQNHSWQRSALWWTHTKCLNIKTQCWCLCFTPPAFSLFVIMF